jgi:hypothetical protein
MYRQRSNKYSTGVSARCPTTNVGELSICIKGLGVAQDRHNQEKGSPGVSLGTRTGEGPLDFRDESLAVARNPDSPEDFPGSQWKEAWLGEAEGSRKFDLWNLSTRGNR